MNVLSLFDGISCGRVALNRAGIKVDNYYASEIDKYAIQVAQKNYPDTQQLGSIKEISYLKPNLFFGDGHEPIKEVENIDLIIGGSPCQGFSRAGKQLNFDDPRSALFFEFVRLLKEIKPKYFLLENVRMKQEWINLITETLKEIYPDTQVHNINSKLVSAQLRNRFYWTNIPNIKQPKDKGIVLQDILESGFTNREKARCILESESRPLKNPAKMLRRYIQTGFTTLVYKENSTLLKVKNATKKGYILVKDNEGVDLSFPTSNTRRGRLMADKLHTITRTPNEYFLFKNGDLRYFTQTELERCQTLPDGYTKGLTKNQSASVIGNGWTVDVITHIFKNIK